MHTQHRQRDVLDLSIPDIEIDDRVTDAIRAGAIVALNLSGGKDSMLASKLAMDALDAIGHPLDRRIGIHADLGRAEWASTKGTVIEQANLLGLPLITVARAAGDMVARWEQRYRQGIDLYLKLEQIRMRGPWSSRSSRFCTPEMKVEPIHRHLAATYPGETIVSVLGIRRAESSGRAATPTSKVDKKLRRTSGTNGIVWNPLAAFETSMVYEATDALNLPLHEAYTVYGSTRLSCAFCVLASRHDLLAASSAEQNAALYRKLVDMEAETGFSFQQKDWLADVAPHLLDDGLKMRIVEAKGYAAERRRIESAIDPSLMKGSREDPWPRRLPDGSEAQAIAEARRLTQEWIKQEVPYRTSASVMERLKELYLARKQP